MGHQDIPLNKHGIEQAHHALPSLQNLRLERLVSSPLLRAKQTAEIIASSLKLPLEVNDALAEIRWGEMEGKTAAEGWSFEKWIQGETPQGAESCESFRTRVVEALPSILITLKKTLIISHNGVYWALMTALGYPNCEALNCVPYFFCPPPTSTNPWFVSPVQNQKN